MVAILLQFAAIMVGMKKLAILLALLLLPSFALGQTGAYSGHSFVGGTPATTSGMNSSNYMDGIIPGASITVYLTGTTTKATIYADGSNTPLSNPFFSNLAPGTNPGGFIFWAAQNQGLDIQAQGGMGNASCTTSPLCYSTATTLQVDVYPNNSFSLLPLNCTGTGSSQVCTFPGTVQGATLTDGTASLHAGSLTGAVNGTFSGTVQGATLTDGTASLHAGSLTGAVNGTFSGTVQGATLTDGTASLHAGSLTGAVNGTFSGTVAAATINDVVICPTTKTVAQCIALLPGAGGTVQFLSATYTSGVSSCVTTPNVVLQGEGMPEFNSGYTALVGGTIINGGVSICASNVTVKDMGFDTGSAYIGGGGTAADGLAFCGATCSNPSDPILQGATIQNVSSLNSSASAAFHAIRVEHYNDVKISNIKAIYGTHGLAIKSDNVQASKIFSAGHGTDDVIVKSDGYTTTSDVQLSDLSLQAVAVGDTTSGVVIDAEASAVVSRVHVSGATAIGLPYGIYFLNNSSFGTGSINSVTLSHLSIYQTHIPSVTSSGIGFSGSSGTVEYSLLDDIHIINGAGSDANNAFLMYAPMNHSTISNVFSYNQNASSFLQGANLSIKGWEDSGSGGAPPTFTSTISGTTVLVTGYNSFRGNTNATTSGGAVIQINGISLDGAHAIVNSPLKGNGGAVTIVGDTGSGFDLIVQNGGATYNSMLFKEGSGLSWGPGNSAPSGTYISDTSQICLITGANCNPSPTFTLVTSRRSHRAAVSTPARISLPFQRSAQTI